ncbi:glycoside hydrolase family 31 protein [Candidatus Uabimicrobium sp. HlEnr_7]|uniref:glycoside hydrolase family 31 protein n=1 Tax=Candidatus Uabimicrobium helgolandensis TaxID=3095367 RepID=UPI003557AF4D
MHEVYFSNVSVSENCVLLHGDYFQGVVELVNENVWRIFVWHRLEDVHKGSWTVEKKENSFKCQDNEDYIVVSAESAPSLKINKNPFSWEWQDFKVSRLDAHNSKDAEEMIDLATGDGNPFAEINDGLPMGSGYTLSINEIPERFYYGLGERTGFLNKKGRTWQNWNTDISKHVPNTDPLYQAHPFLVSNTNGNFCALYLDETWKTNYDLAFSQPQKSFISTTGPTFDLYLIPGPNPQQVVSKYTELVGRSFMPPLWSLGFHQCRWSYPDEKCIMAVAKEYRKREVPLEAMWLDIDYMDGYKVFTFSPHRFPNPKKMTDELQQMNIRTVTIVDPGVKKEPGYEVYESGHKEGMYIKNRRDEEFVGEVWPAPAVWPDFVQENVRKWWGEWLKVYRDAGISGIWNDMNEPAAFKLPGKSLPVGTKQGEYWHAEVHNIYGHMMCKATFDGLKKNIPQKRPFILTRSGFAGIQKYAFVWTGDNGSFWEHLEMSIPMILNMGVSGIPFVGADIGGFSGNCDGEMLSRWTWLGAFYPFMRNHSGKNSRRQEAWGFGEKYLDVVRKAVNFRYALLPYLYTLVNEAHLSGMPIMRPLFFEYPQDDNTYTINDQFLCGKGLLVAPVVRPQQSHRLVYFPEGKWQNIFSGKIFEGPQHLAVETPLENIPIFQNVTTIIPFTVHKQHTSDAYWPELTWRLVLNDTASGHVYCDSGDGEIDGKIKCIKTTYDGKKLHIERENFVDELCVIEILNVNAPSRLEGQVSVTCEKNILRIEMQAEEVDLYWDEV